MINSILQIMVLVLLLMSVAGIIDCYIKTEIKKARLYGKENKTNNMVKIIYENKFIKNYHNLLYNALQVKNKEYMTNNLLLIIMIVSLSLFLYFISINQIFFGIIMPLAINYVILKALTEMKYDINYEIEKQLTSVIDNIIQKFSTHNDLKTIVYEVSLEINNPLKVHFEKLYKLMFFEEQTVALMNFANKVDNIWIHSLVFILISQQTDANKQVVITNLKNLRNMLEKEKSLQSQKQNDNTYGLVVNYFICILAMVANIGVLLFVPTAKNFFFKDMNGIICFSIGYAMLFITILLNLKTTFRKRKKV